jgi:hypothetical protein
MHRSGIAVEGTLGRPGLSSRGQTCHLGNEWARTSASCESPDRGPARPTRGYRGEGREPDGNPLMGFSDPPMPPDRGRPTATTGAVPRGRQSQRRAHGTDTGTAVSRPEVPVASRTINLQLASLDTPRKNAASRCFNPHPGSLPGGTAGVISLIPGEKIVSTHTRDRSRVEPSPDFGKADTLKFQPTPGIDPGWNGAIRHHP